jgi:hypothetical protein
MVGGVKRLVRGLSGRVNLTSAWVGRCQKGSESGRERNGARDVETVLLEVLLKVHQRYRRRSRGGAQLTTPGSLI